MDDLKQKQIIKRRLYGRTVRIVLVVVLILLIRPTWNIYKKSRDSERNLKQAQEELALLEKRQKELSVSLENLKSEEGRDEEIRAKFGVAKAGETMVVVLDDKKPVQTTTTPEEIGAFSRFWSRFLSWFGIK